ncbi:hypothetical protein [Motilimonas sp. KMU-193]|uniref:hypothetical protein n=1 Tax=Motilimonas sp. KMU-193 TaxID=3388668 RepID=UPI00396B3758
MSDYQASAWQANKARELDYDLNDLAGYKLQKRAVKNGAIPHSWFDEHHIYMMRSITAEDVNSSEYADLPQRIDNQMLRLSSFGRYQWLAGLCEGLYAISSFGAKFLAILSFPIALLLSSALNDFWSDLWFFFWFGNSVTTLPFLVVWGLLSLSRRWVIPLIVSDIQPLFELCRTDGKVRIFEPKTGVLKHEFDFADAVAEAVPLVGHQGLVVRYKFVVRHYQHKEMSIQIERLGEDRNMQDICSQWNFIQWFMDTSSPLPDVPALEYWRSFDPVTCEADKRSGRAARYWQDKTDEDIKAYIHTQRTLNQKGAADYGF